MSNRDRQFSDYQLVIQTETLGEFILVIENTEFENIPSYLLDRAIEKESIPEEVILALKMEFEL